MKWMSHFLVALSVVVLAGCGEVAPEQVMEEKPVATDVVETAAVLDSVLAESALTGDLDKLKAAATSGATLIGKDENGMTLLMLAAFNGHVDVVNFLIESGAVVTEKGALNRTALMLAASSPSIETVKILLDNGAEINAIDTHEDWTALMWAAAEGKTEIAKLLIERGADVMMADTDGEDAVYFARQNKHESLAQMLEALKVAKAAK